MQRIETSRIEDKAMDQDTQNREAVLRSRTEARQDATREVPCCCPSCFSYDF